MGSGRLEERIDSFDDEDRAEPRLSIVEWPAGHDPLAEFAAEPDAPRTVPSLEPLDVGEHLELAEPLELPRTHRTPNAYKTLKAYRTDPGYRRQWTRPNVRALLALGGLAAVAVISVITLNSLSGHVAVDSSPPADVVAVNQPAPRTASRAIEPAPREPQSASTSVSRPAAPQADPLRAETARSATPAPATERPRPSVTGNASARTATRQPESLRPIAPPGRGSPPAQQAAGPAAAASRPVDSVAPPVPPPTATTGVMATESVQGPRVDPPAVAAPGAAASAPAIAGPPPTPAASSTAAASPAPPAPAPPPVAAGRVVSPTDAIQSVLGRYAAAFSALDASRAKAVWPSVNERNLARAFESLDEQEFDLGACAITVTAPRAVASCRGTARYTPRVGNRRTRTESRQWTFRLEAEGDSWSIASVESR